MPVAINFIRTAEDRGQGAGGAARVVLYVGVDGANSLARGEEYVVLAHGGKDSGAFKHVGHSPDHGAEGNFHADRMRPFHQHGQGFLA